MKDGFSNPRSLLPIARRREQFGRFSDATGSEGIRSLGRAQRLSRAAPPLYEVVLPVLHYVVDAGTQLALSLRLKRGREFWSDRLHQGQFRLLRGWRRGFGLGLTDPVGHAFPPETEATGRRAPFDLKENQQRSLGSSLFRDGTAVYEIGRAPF